MTDLSKMLISLKISKNIKSKNTKYFSVYEYSILCLLSRGTRYLIASESFSAKKTKEKCEMIERGNDDRRFK